MRTVFALAFATLFMCGCTDYKTQVENLTLEREALMEESSSKDSSINAFIETINEIDSGMKDITARQQLVANENTSGELQSDAKTRIIENMQALDKLLQENKEKLAALSGNLKKSNFKIKELQKMIDGLQMQLALKDSEMVTLNDKISQLNIAVANLNATIDTMSAESKAKSQTIADKTTKINTAYYIIGTYKELYAKGILLKEGGFLGMGKSEMLKKDFNRTSFTMLDITKFDRLPVNAKKAEVISTHPSSSYKLNMDAKKFVTDLTITNAEEFWSASKYLVVMTEK